jgi:hypothetical protein
VVVVFVADVPDVVLVYVIEVVVFVSVIVVVELLLVTVVPELVAVRVVVVTRTSHLLPANFSESHSQRYCCAFSVCSSFDDVAVEVAPFVVAVLLASFVSVAGFSVEVASVVFSLSVVVALLAPLGVVSPTSLLK